VGSYTNETIKGSLGSFCSLLLFFLVVLFGNKKKKKKKIKEKRELFLNELHE
jgi:hypothetical protein